MAFAYFGVLISEESSNAIKAVLLTLLSVCQTVKSFSIFSLFKSTRVLLRIVIEILKDMMAFLIFVISTILAISLFYTSTISAEDLEDETYSVLLFKTFLLGLGDFGAYLQSQLRTWIFILAIVALPLVLLNMLIAIMTDSNDRVREEQVRRDFQEVAGLVYRYETMMKLLCGCRKGKIE